MAKPHMGMSPSEWGPPAWFCLYSLALRLDQVVQDVLDGYLEPESVGPVQRAVFTVIEQVPLLLLCQEHCAPHLADFMDAHPLQADGLTGDALRKWLDALRADIDARKAARAATTVDLVDGAEPLSEPILAALEASPTIHVTATAWEDLSVHGRELLAKRALAANRAAMDQAETEGAAGVGGASPPPEADALQCPPSPTAAPGAGTA